MILDTISVVFRLIWIGLYMYLMYRIYSWKIEIEKMTGNGLSILVGRFFESLILMMSSFVLILLLRTISIIRYDATLSAIAIIFSSILGIYAGVSMLSAMKHIIGLVNELTGRENDQISQ